jgi:DNA-binding CsgD family transcriptional regulator
VLGCRCPNSNAAGDQLSDNGGVPLLEREPELAVLTGTLAQVRMGQGSGIAVVGEPGAGKSAVLAAGAAAAAGCRVLRGGCDPLSTPRPLGPFRDISGAAGFKPHSADDEATLSQWCEDVYAALTTEPTLLIVEDLHWVDAASVEVLRFIARRLDGSPLALWVSYREAEIDSRHSARVLLGDFARLDGVTTLALEPLSVGAVAELVEAAGLDAAGVHAATRGNPFFVTEVAKEPSRPVPSSVRDAVLARAAAVTPEDFEVLQLVAAAPDRLDDVALASLTVDLPTLRRLDQTGLLVRGRGGLLFHHDLARQAVESTIPPGGSQQIHARLLTALESVSRVDPARLTHHAVAAGDRAKAARYARQAAEEATATGAHTEAAAFFRLALEHLDDASPTERADLLQRRSFELYMTSRLAEAIEAIRLSFPLWEVASDTVGLSSAHETCAIYEYYNARRAEAEAQAEAASSAGLDAGDRRSIGEARATRGYLAYMRGDLEAAASAIDESARIAAEYRIDTLAARTLLFRNLTELASGEEKAREAILNDIDAARATVRDELASTGYSQLAYVDVEFRRFRSAERVLEESLPFTIDRDIPICHHWQRAVRSRLRFGQGRWQAAQEDADYVLTEEGMPVARVWPLVVTGLMALRRGMTLDIDDPFEAAWQLANQLDEPLRRLPVLAALAERMWMSGEPDPRVADAVTAVGVLDGRAGTEWVVGDLAAWLARLNLLTGSPTQVAEPYRMAQDGRHADAAAWWRNAGDPFAEAMSLSDSSDPKLQVQAVELLDRLEASGTADRLRTDLRGRGVVNIPARPRISTRTNPAGLTNRQLDVAKLVARGFTNAEIAARLFISPKTTDHHVSAVLTKLGVPTRRAVMLQADELGL